MKVYAFIISLVALATLGSTLFLLNQDRQNKKSEERSTTDGWFLIKDDGSMDAGPVALEIVDENEYTIKPESSGVALRVVRPRNTPSDSQSLDPGDPGSYWIYKNTNEDSKSHEVWKVSRTYNVGGYEYKVWNEETDSSETDTVFHTVTLNDGVYSKSKKESDPVLIYKYPCEVGDEYETETGSALVISLNKKIETTIGIFSCIEYRFEEKGQEGEDDRTFREFVCPGVGVVKTGDMELVGFELQPLN